VVAGSAVRRDGAGGGRLVRAHSLGAALLILEETDRLLDVAAGAAVDLELDRGRQPWGSDAGNGTARVSSVAKSGESAFSRGGRGSGVIGVDSSRNLFN
jgi:hypothetical protein